MESEHVGTTGRGAPCSVYPWSNGVPSVLGGDGVVFTLGSSG